MPPQLANPAAWIEPTFRQAWADFMVANHLVAFPLNDELHQGQPAILERPKEPQRLVQSIAEHARVS